MFPLAGGPPPLPSRTAPPFVKSAIQTWMDFQRDGILLISFSQNKIHLELARSRRPARDNPDKLWREI
jgi:hypothetical protein